MRFLVLGALLACACASPPERPRPAGEDLQRVAEAALGGREGAVLVMDPQDGRLRAVVNPRLAFEQAFPPGSAIKPFTALAGLRAGLVDRETRRLCRGRYADDEFEIACSHPRSAAPFDLPQALAYSCNDYFAHLGERLSEGTFNATLAAFGFGARTGVNAGSEATGSLPRGEWSPATALGESDRLLVTPVQLLAAYAALVNGGHLYRPRWGMAEEAEAPERARLQITAAHRAVLVEGMRGALKYGTAAGAKLGELPLTLFGKTGTSTASNQFRTQGWFVGFAADRADAPESVCLAVLVFLRRAHGADCAAVARLIFEAGSGQRSAVSEQQAVRVRRVSDGVTAQLGLEEYVAGVLAAEASVEQEGEALKAQAVASRTFALRNLGRHAREGYDFCSTTHCQRYAPARDGPGRGAAAETATEVLRDRGGQLIEAYFHAACGGATANIEALWGVRAPPYLRGVRDDYCATMPHHRWEQLIPAARLAAALRGDARSDVGARLDEVVVARRDASGRAEWVTLEGERRRMLRGWDFKIIVGRALGWEVLKSSRFEVARAGSSFVFRGSGFGHGLGLCQEGAHVLARRGANYREILSHYYPGTNADIVNHGGHGGEGEDQSPQSPRAPRGSFFNRRLSLASEHFRASFPAGADRGEVEEALRALEAARADVLQRLEAAGVRLSEPGAVELFVHAATADFIAATGQPGWVAAVTRGRRIETQPLGALRRRGALATTLRHEYTHTAIEALGRGRAPRWLAEGLAAHVAGEGASLARVKTGLNLSRDQLERRLARPASAAEMRALYAAAYREVLALIRAEGESAVWRRSVV